MDEKIKRRELVVYSFFRAILHSSVELLMIAALYTLLTLAMTYPLILYFGRAIPGWQGDAEIGVWSLWWVKYALMNLHTNFGLTEYIFYPNTVNLLSADLSPVNGLLSLVLQPVVGVIGSYDGLYLFSFVASGIGTYMLLRYLGCSRYAAFLGGAIFAFAPYRFAQGMGHFALLTTEWIPFFALYLTKTIREGKPLHFVLAPFFFFMTVYSEAYYAVFTMLLGIMIIALHGRLITKSFLKRCATIAIPASFLLATPLLMLVIDAIGRHSLSGPSPLAGTSAGEAVLYSADLLGYFIPSVFSPIAGQVVYSGIASHFTSNATEYTTSLGYVTLIFICYAALRMRKFTEVRIWTCILVASMLLSFGPVLHIMGRTTFTEFQVSIPMPYIILWKLLPAFRVFRVSSRFAVIVMLAASVLVGFAMTDFLRGLNVRLPRASKILAMGVLALLLVEFAVVPIPVHAVPVSPFYYHLSKEPGGYAILDLPQDPRIGENGIDVTDLMYLYYQTIHQKRIVGGAIPRAAENILEFTDSTPIISDLVYPFKCVLACSSPDIITEDAAVAQNVLGYYNIRYAILHKDLGHELRVKLDQTLLDNFFKGYPPVYEDEDISVYRVVTPDHFQPFLSLEYGWGPLEIFPTNMPTRWMSSDSGVTIFNPASTTMQLGFSAASLHGTRTLEVYADNELVATLKVPDNRFETLRVTLFGKPGKTISVQLRSKEACETPKSLGINEDSRCLSMAFRNLSVTELGAGTEEKAPLVTVSKEAEPLGYAAFHAEDFDDVRAYDVRETCAADKGILAKLIDPPFRLSQQHVE